MGAMADRHILIVDDDLLFAEATKRVLASAGFRVSTATHFTEALRILESDDPPELLLTDIHMPSSINGIALSRMARMRHRDMCVVYVTGYDLPAGVGELKEPILRKPISDDELVNCIRSAFASPAAESGGALC